MTRKCILKFSITANFIDEVELDVVPLDICGIVLGSRYLHDRKTIFHRHENKYHLYKNEPSGGIGAFTPDNFPIFDVMKDNCYMILDSNHGYKMIGVGQLVAKEILGEKQTLLKPFRFERYAEGELHPVSHSPFPWS